MPQQIQQSVFDKLEPQLGGTSNGSTYGIIGPKLDNIRKAMKSKEEIKKFDRLRQQMHDNVKVVQLPEINESYVPQNKRRVVLQCREWNENIMDYY